MRRAIHDALPEPAAVDAAEANPKAMVEAAKKGDMARRAQAAQGRGGGGREGDALEVHRRDHRADRLRQPDQDVQVPGDEGCGREREEQERSAPR